LRIFGRESLSLDDLAWRLQGDSTHWVSTMAMPVLSMLLASPISPPIAVRLLGGQVITFWVGQIVRRHGLSVCARAHAMVR